MAQLFTVEARGLVTNPNDLAAAQGSMSQADNIDISREGVFQPSRGFERHVSNLAGIPVVTRATTVWNGTRIVYYDETGGGDTGKIAYIDNSGNYVEIMLNVEPPQGRSTITFMEAGNCLYWTSNQGVYVLDALGNTPVIAGGLKALDGQAKLTGKPGFMGADEQRSYRIVWAKEDAQGNLVRGTPSGRIIAANAYVTIPAGHITRVGTTVTVSTAPSTNRLTAIGQVVALAPGETNFPAGNKTIVSTPGAASFTYVEAGAASSSTTAETFIYPSTTVDLTFTIPTGATLNHEYQIYRTFASADGNTAPDDNHYLVLTGNPTQSQLTTGTITVEDICPDSLMGAALYTNPNQEGLQEENDPPPFAKDMTTFKSTTFYANTIDYQRLALTLFAVGDPSGLSAGNIYVRVGSTTYSFSTASTGSPTHGKFDIYLYGTPAQNVADTANSIVHAMNVLAGFPLRAFYVSNANDVPGKIVIESENLNDGPFYVYTNFRAVAWSPQLPLVAEPADFGSGPIHNLVRTGGNVVTFSGLYPHAFSVGDTVHIEAYAGATPDANFPFGPKVITSIPAPQDFTYVEAGTNGTTTTYAQGWVRPLTDVASSADTFINGLYYSKPQEAQAVPGLNFFKIGDDSEQILRIVTLRDGLFVFKTDGTYRVTDTADGNWVVTPFDNTIIATAPFAICFGDNQIWALTNKGVMNINDAGGNLTSRVIENVLLKIINDAGAQKVFDRAFATFYESDHRLYMWVPADSDPTHDYADFAFVFNTITNTWVRRVKKARCAAMDPTVNKMMVGYENLLIERKSLTAKDFIDEQAALALSIDSVASDGLSFTWDSVVVPEVGDIIFKNYVPDPNWNAVAADAYAVVTAVDAQAGVAYIDRNIGLTVSENNVLKHIECTVVWNPQHGGDPTVVKQFTEAQAFFGRVTTPSISFCFSTELSPGFACQSVSVANPESAWGLFPWGGAGWGQTVTENSVSRMYIPTQKQRGRLLYVKMNWQAQGAYAEWNGIGIQGRSYSTSTMQSQR